MKNNLVNVECNLADAANAGDRLTKRLLDTFCGKLQAKSAVHRANAAAEIAKIKAQSDIEVADIRARANNRVAHEELKNQHNIESITRLAIQDLNSASKPEVLDEDWLAYFFSKSRIISNTEMQSLWAKILAGQCNNPESFSKKTIDLASHLESKDAHLFTKFATFTILMDEPHLKTRNCYPLLLNYQNNQKMFLEMGITFDDLIHLEDLGLIKLNTFGGYSYTASLEKVRGTYFDKEIEFTLERDASKPESSAYAYQLEVGSALLTRAGNELIKICGAQANYNFFIECQKYWTERGNQLKIIE